MQKGVVYKNKDFWCGHPDVAYFKGHFYVVFRQSNKHRETGRTKIMLCRSKSGFRYSTPVCLLESEDRLNCPRLSVVGEYLYLICDKIKNIGDFNESENNQYCTSVVIMNSFNGEEWSYPLFTNIIGIVPDKICVVNNFYLIATHCFSGERLIQNVWKNSSLSEKGWKKIELADLENHHLCEASLVNTSFGLIGLMRENSHRGDPLFWSESTDEGESWSSPKRTNIFGGHRPVVGRLHSGNYLITYREQSFCNYPPYWAKNTFACLVKGKSFVDNVHPCYESIILPLDHDHSVRSDGGYTGFVETEDNQIYIVNYITKDALRPYIVWYLINEKEF